MQTFHLLTVVIVATQLAIYPARTQTVIKPGRSSVNLELGARTILQIDRPFASVLIGNPNVIDLQTQGEHSLLLKPLNLGSTNLVIIDGDGIVIANVRIVVRNAGPI